jgi:hypothetical protein
MKQALTLVDEIGTMTAAFKNQRLSAKVAALRKCLLNLSRK